MYFSDVWRCISSKRFSVYFAQYKFQHFFQWIFCVQHYKQSKFSRKGHSENLSTFVNSVYSCNLDRGYSDGAATRTGTKHSISPWKLNRMDPNFYQTSIATYYLCYQVEMREIPSILWQKTTFIGSMIQRRHLWNNGGITMIQRRFKQDPQKGRFLAFQHKLK